MKILISDPDSKISLGIIRSLGLKNYEIEMFHNHKRPLCYYSKFCKKINILPDYNSKNFNTKFLKLIKKNKYHLVIPVQYKSFFFLSKIKKKILKYSNFVCENHNRINFVSSKKKVNHLSKKIKDKNFRVIETHKYETVSKLTSKNTNINFPLVIKPAYEQGGNSKNIFYVKNFFEINEIFNKLGSTKKNILKYIIQKKIDGVGRGFFALCKNGKCLNTFQHQRIREMPISGGMSVAAKSIFDKNLQKIGEKIVKKIKWTGLIMLEFKYHANKYYLIEINPKFWGSLDLAIASNVDFPNKLVSYANGIKSKKRDLYRLNMKFHWPLNGDLQNSIKNPKIFLRVILDILNPFVKSNIWIIKDPIVTLYMMYKFIKGLKKL